jgi:hypothetical protein
MEFNLKIWVIGNGLNCRSLSMNFTLFNLNTQPKYKNHTDKVAFVQQNKYQLIKLTQ